MEEDHVDLLVEIVDLHGVRVLEVRSELFGQNGEREGQTASQSVVEKVLQHRGIDRELAVQKWLIGRKWNETQNGLKDVLLLGLLYSCLLESTKILK